LPRRGPDAYPRIVDKGRLIPIGRFANLTDLSPRLLRRLDERGLLSPVLVDPDTRYRYYDLSQTRAAGLIHLGRQLGLTLDQLGDLLGAWEHGDLRRTLERHRESVAQRLAEQSRLLRLLDQELGRDEPLMTYEIGVKEVPAVVVMSAEGSIARTHPHDPWSLESALRRTGARIKVQVARHGEEPVPHPLILYHADLEHDAEIRFEVCFPIARRLPGCPGVRCKELPAARVAFTTFRGPYDTIWNAYVELHAWIADHGHVARGPVREQGIVTDSDTDDTRQWLTELAVPLSA
jgi:DNA-binding transcriptional MerR regulator